MNDMTTLTHEAKRATAGRSVLGWVALACLILNGAFWGSLMLDLLAPPKLFSPQTIQAGLSIAAFALVLPLAWSSLLPNSPAMRLLQRQSWHLPGQLAITVAAVFLTWLAGNWLYLWWHAQPNIANTGQALFLTISSLIAGTLVPALSWATMTPEQWIAAVEQARHVKRLEWALKMEETTMRAYYARAVALLSAGLTNLSIEQKRELAGILGGFARTQQQALDQVAASWREMYGVDALMGTVNDQVLIDQYKEVAALLTEGGDAMSSSANYADEVRALAAPNDRTDDDDTREYVARSLAAHRTRAPHQDTAKAVRSVATERPNGSVQRTTSGPAVGHRTTERTTERTPHEQAFATARQGLRGAWRRAELEQVLSVSKTQAHAYIQAWLASGDIIKLDEPKDHYSFMEAHRG